MSTNFDETHSTILTSKCEENYLFNQDSVHLREIFPAEVWNVITSKLSKNSLADGSLENLYNSSRFFGNLVANQNTLFLFEKVIKITTATVWNKESLQGLSVKELLKMRQICFTWCKVIDQFIWGKIQDLDNVPEQVRQDIEAIITNEFGDPREKLFQFLEHFEDTHHLMSSRNPLIFPILKVITKNEGEMEEEDDEVDLEYLEGLSTLLTRYGHHLQNLQIYFRGDALFLAETEKMRDWLENTPNLKTLEIHNETEWLHSYINEYESQIQETPFPKLNILENMTSGRLPGPLFTQLICKNSHISKLILSQTGQIDEYFNFPSILPNLKYLQMGNVQTLGNLYDYPFFQVQWPKLEILKMSCLYVNDNFKWFHIFAMIQQNFAKTLVHLFLELPKILLSEKDKEECWQSSNYYRLDIPLLKELHLTLTNPASLDFLLAMKDTLEVLKLDLGYLKDRDGDKVENLEKSETIVKLVGFE